MTIVGKGGTVRGTSKRDVIVLTRACKVLAGAGNDLICGSKGSDEIHGGRGNDRIFGNAGDDDLFGDAGDDLANGGVGNDSLEGGSGRDRCNGGSGNSWTVRSVACPRVADGREPDSCSTPAKPHGSDAGGSESTVLPS